jgi:hypothetical protein
VEGVRQKPDLERKPSRAPNGTEQSTTSGTGMTQEMEALAFEGSQGVELTDEEAEESARAYDEAQVMLCTTATLLNRMTKMLEPVLAGGEGSGRGRGEDGGEGGGTRQCGKAGESEQNSTIPQIPHTASILLLISRCVAYACAG